MSFQPLVFLGISCVVAFVLASWTVSAGAGFFAAFMVYSVAGSGTLVLLSAFSFLTFSEDDGHLMVQDVPLGNGGFQRV